MKIYISGKITGLPIEEAKQRFDDAENLLMALNTFQEVVNPMKNGLPETATWKQHIIHDISMLLECDAIFMTDNWIDSKGARIEYFIASEMGMKIFFGRSGITSISMETHETISVAAAIKQVTGLYKENYIRVSRRAKFFFPRMIFAYHCAKHGMDATEIGLHINRERTTVSYLIKQYEIEYKHNPTFRDMAQKVEKAITKLKSQNKHR